MPKSYTNIEHITQFCMPFEPVFSTHNRDRLHFTVQIFAMIIVLQAGGFISLWLSFKVTKYICFFFAAYLSLNTIMNIISKSRKEKYVMTPLSLIAGICFWITAFQM